MLLRRALTAMPPLAIVVACFVVSVVVPPDGRNDDAIEESLAAAASDAGDGELVQLDWRPLSFLAYDRLLAFGNAATRAGIERRLGFSWPEGAPAIPPAADETLLVFVAGRSVVAWRRVDRDEADLGCLAALRALARPDALLVARRDKGTLAIGAAGPIRGARQARRASRCAAAHGLPEVAASR